MKSNLSSEISHKINLSWEISLEKRLIFRDKSQNIFFTHGKNLKSIQNENPKL